MKIYLKVNEYKNMFFILALQRISLTIKLEWGRFHSDLNTNWETQKTVVTEISVKYYCIKENKSIKHEKFSIQTGILVLRFVFKSHLISHCIFWTFSRCFNFDKNSGSLLKSNTDIAAIQKGKGVDLWEWDLKQLCNLMLSMIESRSQGQVQSSPAQHHNHILCTTIDSHSFLPGVLLGGSWAYKGNHVREIESTAII